MNYCHFVQNIYQTICQCSICTKTASQLGEGPAQGLNSAILYLMAAPFVIIAVIFFRWWKKEKEILKEI